MSLFTAIDDIASTSFSHFGAKETLKKFSRENPALGVGQFNNSAVRMWNDHDTCLEINYAAIAKKTDSAESYQSNALLLTNKLVDMLPSMDSLVTLLIYQGTENADTITRLLNHIPEQNRLHFLVIHTPEDKPFSADDLNGMDLSHLKKVISLDICAPGVEHCYGSTTRKNVADYKGPTVRHYTTAPSPVAV